MLLRITNITSRSTLIGHFCPSHISGHYFLSLVMSPPGPLVGHTRLLLSWLWGRIRYSLTQLLPRPLAINLVCCQRLLTRVIFSCFCAWKLFLVNVNNKYTLWKSWRLPSWLKYWFICLESWPPDIIAPCEWLTCNVNEVDLCQVIKW